MQLGQCDESAERKRDRERETERQRDERQRMTENGRE